MRKKYLLLIIYGVLHSVAGIAQQDQKIDSLLTVLKSQNEDTNKVNTLNALSKQFLLAKNIPDANKYAGDALLLAEKKGFKNGISNAHISFGNVYNRQGATYSYEGNYPEALKNYLAALKIFEKNEYKRGIANARRNIGLVYWIQGNYSEALKNHLISLNQFKEIDDKKAIAAAYNDIGNVYENQGNHTEALKNYLTSLKIYEETGDKGSMINRLFNIGFLYDNQGNHSEALRNFLAALKISEEIGTKEGIASSYNNIGGIYYNQGKAEPETIQKEKLYNQALNSYLNSLKKFKELGDKEYIAVSYNSIGELYLELKNFSKAKKFLNDGLSLFKQVGTIEDGKERYQLPVQYILENYRLLTKLDSSIGDWKGAFNNHKLYIYYRESIISEENAQKILKTQMEYDFDKKEDSLKYKQQLSEEKLKQQTLLTKEQKLLKNYLLAGIVLFAILSFFVYRNYRTRQQLKLQTLRNKIASDLHDDVGSTLSSISIFSQMAQQQSKESIPLLETIEESSRKMLDAMADIVWSIHPENDQFEKIILRMKSFAYELLGAKNIDFEFVTDDYVTKINVPMNVRKNVYLIFKEATNNMVKYASADRAFFSIKGEKNNLTLLIKDNGKGFDTDQLTNGNGLKNMKKRAGEISGELVIDSSPGNGTFIQLRVAV